MNDNTNTWAAVWGDYDNDGYLDLFVVRPGTRALGVGNANILYHNNGDGTFTDRGPAEGVALQDDLKTSAHKLAAWGDYNNDGFLDLVVQDGIAPTKLTGESTTGYHYLLKSNGNADHFLKVNLKGTPSNRAGKARLGAASGSPRGGTQSDSWKEAVFMPIGQAVDCDCRGRQTLRKSAVNTTSGLEGVDNFHKHYQTLSISAAHGPASTSANRPPHRPLQ